MPTDDEARKAFGWALFNDRPATTLNTKQHLANALLGPMHGIYVEPEPVRTATPDFDGGVRGINEPQERPSEPLYFRKEPGGWYSAEIENGAELFFPWLKEGGQGGE